MNPSDQEIRAELDHRHDSIRRSRRPVHVSVPLRQLWRRLGLPPDVRLEREWRRRDSEPDREAA